MTWHPGDSGHVAEHNALDARLLTAEGVLKGPVWANITDPLYGATTGSTDNATAIQAALDAVNSSGGGAVYVPFGVFLVGTGGLTVYSNTTLCGPGTLKMKNAANIVLVSLADGASNIVLTGITLDGNQANQSSSSSYCVRINTNTDVTIHGVEVKNSRGVGIVGITNSGTDPIRTVRVTDCYIHDCGTHALDFRGIDGLVISDNIITAWGVVTAANAAVAFSPATFFVKNLAISGNVFRNTVGTQFAIESASGTYSAVVDGASIVGNTFDSGGSNGGGVSGWFFRTVIANNAFVNGAGTHRSGLEIVGTDNALTGNTITDGIVAYASSAGGSSGRSVIAGNTIINSVATGTCVSVGGNAGPLTDLIIQDNILTLGNAASQSCIYLGVYGTSGQINRVSVRGNRCRSSSAGNGNGIRLQTLTGSSDVEVAGNSCSGLANGWLDTADANTTDVTVRDNDFRGCTTPVNHSATGTPFRIFGNITGIVTAVASGATVTLPPRDGEVVVISGTTTITSITAGYAGQRATLLFQGSLTFTDGSNLKLNGDFVTAADDTISLVCDGTNWYETGRSADLTSSRIAAAGGLITAMTVGDSYTPLVANETLYQLDSFTEARINALPVNLPAGTYDQLAIEVSAGGGTNSVIRLGIYDDLNGRPNSLVVDAGTVDTTGTGLLVKTINQVLVAGRYWLASCLQGSAATKPTVRCATGSTTTGVQVLSHSGVFTHSTSLATRVPVSQNTGSNTAGLPSPFAANAQLGNNGVIVRIRRSA